MSDPLGAKIAENTGGGDTARKSRPERMPRSTPPGSLRFAAAIAVPCLVASLGLGFGTIYVPRLFEDPPPAAAAPEPYDSTSSPTWSTSDYPTTSTTAPDGTPDGYFRYTGTEGLGTVLPDSFTVLSGNEGTLVAKNQFDPDVEVRFGGAQPKDYDELHETIAKAAEATASSRTGYVQLALERTSHGGVLDAVDWEFQYDNREGRARWSWGHYWRAGGIEYVLLVDAPPDRRDEAARLLQTMIDHSGTS
jgi:hypothetical protein